MKKNGKILIFALAAVLLGAVLYIPISRARREARITSCKSSLKNIGLLWEMYVQDYGETVLPLDFSSVRQMFDTNVVEELDLFLCPLSGAESGKVSEIDSWSSYVFVKDTEEKVTGQRVVLFCKFCNNVLWHDGHVSWEPSFRKEYLDGKYADKAP